MSIDNPSDPAEYAAAIGRALDREDELILNFLTKKFSLIYPTQFRQFSKMVLDHYGAKETK